jgi:hypothetical protein
VATARSGKKEWDQLQFAGRINPFTAMIAALSVAP